MEKEPTDDGEEDLEGGGDSFSAAAVRLRNADRSREKQNHRRNNKQPNDHQSRRIH